MIGNIGTGLGYAALLVAILQLLSISSGIWVM